jgi:hypothetical protein
METPTLPVLRLMPTLPTRWEQARPAIVRGLAALAVGTAAEMARREGFKKLASFLVRRVVKSRTGETKPIKVDQTLVEEDELERGEGEVSEVFYYRRTRIRR